MNVLEALRAQPRIATLMSVLGLAALAAGCSPTAAPMQSPSFPAWVWPERAQIVLREDDVAGGGSPRAGRVAALVHRLSHGRPDTVYVTLAVPGGSERIAASAARALQRLGVQPSRIRQAAGSPDRRGAVVLTVERFTSAPLPCESLAEVPPDPSFVDARYEMLGCANQGNLAVMAAYPRDLLGHHAWPSQDGERAASPVGWYRDFKTPPLPNRASVTGATPARQGAGPVP